MAQMQVGELFILGFHGKIVPDWLKEFAARFGFSVKNVQNWEQGLRRPEGPARAYLHVIEREPEAVARALARA